MQRLNHHHLYMFWIFEKTENFTKTAEELRIAQSAVTSQLRALEESLGLSLIDRTNSRRPQITNEGRKVLEYADSIFESSRELMNWATQGSSPRVQILRVGAISGLSRNLQYEFIKPLLGRTKVRFEITTGDQETLVEQMSQHRLDVILTSRSIRGEYGGKMHAHVLTSSPLVFVVNREHRKTKQSFKEALKKHELFIPGRNFEARPELDAYLESLNSEIRTAGEIDDIALLRIIALRSGSIVAVPEMGVAQDLLDGDLQILEFAKGVQQRFYAITKQKLRPSGEIKMLIETMRA